jgi:putative ABC transport system permease protein
MNISDIFIRAGRNLRESKARTILTALAIAVGATTITIAMAAGNGGREYTNNIVKSSGDAYSLSVFKQPSTPEVTSTELPEYGVDTESESAQNDMITNKDLESIRALNGVQSISPMLDVTSEYVSRGEGQKKYIAPLSVKADRTKIDLAAGSLTDNMVTKGQIIISEAYVGIFGFSSPEAAIGQTLEVTVAQNSNDGSKSSQLKTFTFTIAAVDRKSDTNLYYNEAVRISSEDSQLIYDFQSGELAAPQYYGMNVLAKPGSDVVELQKTITDRGYQVYSLEDQREQLLQVIDIAQWALIGFGALAVIASVFGIINTQYISVLERTQQIGLMKAVGASRKDISRLFRYEAAWVGMLGGVIGVFIAFLVTLLNPTINEMLNLEAGTQLLKMDWLASLGLIIGLMIISVLSGYFPSRKAAKLDPIEALRTE